MDAERAEQAGDNRDKGKYDGDCAEPYGSKADTLEHPFPRSFNVSIVAKGAEHESG
jgi:hypothetical protein